MGDGREEVAFAEALLLYLCLLRGGGEGRDWRAVEFQPGMAWLKDFNPGVDTMLWQRVLYSHEGLTVFPD